MRRPRRVHRLRCCARERSPRWSRCWACWSSGASRARGDAAARRIVDIAERTVVRSGIGNVDVVRASRLPVMERAFVGALAAAVHLVVVYATVGFVLRQFPYTRPWGESMRGFLLATAKTLGLGVANAIPGLFTVVDHLPDRAFRRPADRRSGSTRSSADGSRRAWIYPETAQPTRRLLTGLLWLFAVVVAYPYMPGSQTDAFKGVSVFLGLIVTFGSSGIVNQIMSGFTITYSRALRLGDFVRIGDVEGTVTHLGVLSTKVRTLLAGRGHDPQRRRRLADHDRLLAVQRHRRRLHADVGDDRLRHAVAPGARAAAAGGRADGRVCAASRSRSCSRRRSRIST